MTLNHNLASFAKLLAASNAQIKPHALQNVKGTVRHVLYHQPNAPRVIVIISYRVLSVFLYLQHASQAHTTIFKHNNANNAKLLDVTNV